MDTFDTSKKIRTFNYAGKEISSGMTDLLVEMPLDIVINDQEHILIMFTPHMTRELVMGFVFTEGLISDISEIERCTISQVQKEDGEEIIEARVMISSKNSNDDNQSLKRRRVSYSSCGVCGKDSFSDLGNGLTRVKSAHRFSMDVLMDLPNRMLEFQPLYQKTGGAHAAMLFDGDGNPVLQSEDMGRHNALDKVIGYTLINEISRDDKVIFSSGRASLEMILKTARAGFPVFVAKSRPTSKAVEAAKFYNITLIDLARDTNRIYSHARRIKGF